MSSLIGKSLQGGKYKLEDVLGRGGFGLTFRAHQNYLDQLVVIKTLNESYWSDPNLEELQQQFQDEARRLALCSHPNVVRVSDFFVEDQLPYMVMDYIPGRSLYDIVLPETGSPQPLSEAAAVNYVQQIGKALQAVHSKGLLHRDVKPQNIMVHQLTGEAVLIDFGIARELSQNPNKTHTSIVSEGYAPIEQYLPKAQRSAATDIYGLAATLYTLLTGVVPVAAVLRDRTPLVPVHQLRSDVSPSVVDAIAQGMAVELKDRPQSVGRWLGTLTQRSGFLGRTRKPNSKTQLPTPGASTFPTKVVSPGYQSVPNATGGKTVAVQLPTNDQTDVTRTNIPAAQPQKSKGGGCFSSLLMAAILLAGIGTAGGYWLYNQLNPGGATIPEIALPGEEPEEVVVEDSTETAEDESSEDTTGDEDAEENGIPDLEKPKKDKPVDRDETVEPEPIEPNRGSNPPLVIANSGNPANARPGDTGSIVAVPGFAPGNTRGQIVSRLGDPTRESNIDGYDTSVYELVPNRVMLAYVYDPDTQNVQQSEATFSGSVDRLVMRTTLSGMLDGRSNQEIVGGLEAVRQGDRDRFAFESRGFSGVIERNSFDHIHIYVQN
ncbi:MAG: serine/threonine-protein kinase [Cyanobacteria bacterium J06634_6]